MIGLYAILGEHRSDAETLKVLVRRIADDPRLSVKIMGFGGGGELKNKGAKHLKNYARLGCTRFVVCHDADGPDPLATRDQVEARVIRPSGLGSCCVVVPVQEIEAWVLADIAAVTKIFSGWRPEPISNPEGIKDPKEFLKRLSDEGVSRPRYSHATHNPRVANHLSLELLEKKCPSFRPFASFVRAAS